MDHLSEKQKYFEAHVKHYISKEQPEDNSDDYLKKNLMFELSAVLNTCDDPSHIKDKSGQISGNPSQI